MSVILWMIRSLLFPLITHHPCCHFHFSIRKFMLISDQHLHSLTVMNIYFAVPSLSFFWWTEIELWLNFHVLFFYRICIANLNASPCFWKSLVISAVELVCLTPETHPNYEYIFKDIWCTTLRCSDFLKLPTQVARTLGRLSAPTPSALSKQMSRWSSLILGDPTTPCSNLKICVVTHRDECQHLLHGSRLHILVLIWQGSYRARD